MTKHERKGLGPERSKPVMDQTDLVDIQQSLAKFKYDYITGEAVAALMGMPYVGQVFLNPMPIFSTDGIIHYRRTDIPETTAPTPKRVRNYEKENAYARDRRRAKRSDVSVPQDGGPSVDGGHPDDNHPNGKNAETTRGPDKPA